MEMFPLAGTLCIPASTKVSKETLCGQNSAPLALLREHSFLPAVLGQWLSPISASCQGTSRTVMDISRPLAAFPSILFGRKIKRYMEAGGEGRDALKGNPQTGFRSPRGIWVSRCLHSTDASGHRLPPLTAPEVMLTKLPTPGATDRQRSEGGSPASIIFVRFFFF